MRKATLLLGAPLLLLLGCTNPTDEAPNVFPGDRDPGAANVDPGGSDPGPKGDGGTADAGPALCVTAAGPVSYHISCMSIRKLGDQGEDAIQAQVLRAQWNNDICRYRLNILLTFQDYDEGAGTVTIVAGGGIGSSADDLCFERTTRGKGHVGTITPSTVLLDPLDDNDCTTTSPKQKCAAEPTAAAGTEECGDRATVHLEMPKEDPIYIYAASDEGVAFNCTPDVATPDAVPIRAIRADFTFSADRRQIAGKILGCLSKKESEQLCSCLETCNDKVAPKPGCEGCPNGSGPLSALIGLGINPTQECQDRLGEPGYTIEVLLTAKALSFTPSLCP